MNDPRAAYEAKAGARVRRAVLHRVIRAASDVKVPITKRIWNLLQTVSSQNIWHIYQPGMTMKRPFQVRIHNIRSGRPEPEIEILYAVYQDEKVQISFYRHQFINFIHERSFKKKDFLKEYICPGSSAGGGGRSSGRWKCWSRSSSNPHSSKFLLFSEYFLNVFDFLNICFSFRLVTGGCQYKGFFEIQLLSFQVLLLGHALKIKAERENFLLLQNLKLNWWDNHALYIFSCTS